MNKDTTSTNEVKGLTFYPINNGACYSVMGAGSATCGKIVIPSVYKGKPVTRIGHYAFNGCSSLTSIKIPNSVTSIGNFAFDGCSSLTSIEIPNSVKCVGDGIFYRCKSLSNIRIPFLLMSKDLFNDLTIFYSLKLKLFKNNSNIKLDKTNIDILSEIEKTLKTVPKAIDFVLGFIGLFLCIVSLIVCIFIGVKYDVSTSLIFPLGGLLFVIIMLFVTKSIKDTKLNNIENAFLKLDYNQKMTKEEVNKQISADVELIRNDTEKLSIKEKLIQLKELYEEGLITETEYIEKRKDYISKL